MLPTIELSDPGDDAGSDAGGGVSVGGRSMTDMALLCCASRRVAL